MINYTLVNALKEKKLTIACAESCTGGLIAKSITDVGGCSSVFLGGVVAYANEIKENVLGVSGETLKKYGAVSEFTAMEMANGVRRICGSDIGISTTGIAGPDGGTEQDPVGTVYIAVKAPSGTVSHRIVFGTGHSSREEIRSQAASRALFLALSQVKKG